jgi:hypothetical protein
LLFALWTFRFHIHIHAFAMSVSSSSSGRKVRRRRAASNDAAAEETASTPTKVKLRRRVRKQAQADSPANSSAGAASSAASSAAPVSPALAAVGATLERGASHERRRKKLSFHTNADGRTRSPASLVELCMLEIGRDLESYATDIASLPSQMTERIIAFVVSKLMQPMLTATNQLVVEPHVVLRVRFPGDGRVASMRFAAAQSVLETKSQIFAKLLHESTAATPPSSVLGLAASSAAATAATPPSDVDQFGLFQPYGAFTQPRWLRDDCTLAFYDLRPGDELEFKQKMTLLRSRFLSPWDTIKTFVVDGTLTVQQLAATLATKLGRDNPDEYSLKLQHGSTGRARWLRNTLTLAEQHVDPTQCYLQLKKQYFFAEDAAASSESSCDAPPAAPALQGAADSSAAELAALHNEFCQSLDAIVSATFPATLAQCITFAALQCCVRFGAWTEQSPAASFNLAEYVPHEYVAQPRLSSLILRQWRTLGALSQLAAKRQYITMVRSMPTYGFTFFQVYKLPSTPNAHGQLSELSQLLSSHSLLGDERDELFGAGALSSSPASASGSLSSATTSDGDLVAASGGIDLLPLGAAPTPVPGALGSGDSALISAGANSSASDAVGGGSGGGSGSGGSGGGGGGGSGSGGSGGGGGGSSSSGGGSALSHSGNALRMLDESDPFVWSDIEQGDASPRLDGSGRVLIGVSETHVQFLHPTMKKVLLTYSLARLHRWHVCHNKLVLYFGPKGSPVSRHDDVLPADAFVSAESTTISELFSTYIHHKLLQRSRSQPSLLSLASERANDQPLLLVDSPLSSPQQSPRRRRSRHVIGLDGRVARARAGSVQFERETQSGEFVPLSTRTPADPSAPRRSALYVEPQRLYLNPLAHRVNAARLRLAQQNGGAEARRCVRLVRALSELTERVRLLDSAAREPSTCRVLIRFLDRTEKQFLVDASRDVQHIAGLIALEQGLRRPSDEFSLQYRRKGQAHDQYEWLNPYLPLAAQIDVEDSEHSTQQHLLFKKKFHFAEPMVSDDDPVFLNLVFCQAQHALVRGSVVCDLEQGVQLVATQFQINFGDHNPSIHLPGFLKREDLRHFCFSTCLSQWQVSFTELEKMLYKEHAKLRGLKTAYAKYRYVQLCQGLRLYATALFDVRPMVSASSHAQHSTPPASPTSAARFRALSRSPARPHALNKSNSFNSITGESGSGGAANAANAGSAAGGEATTPPRSLPTTPRATASLDDVVGNHDDDSGAAERPHFASRAIAMAAARVGGAAVQACLGPLPDSAVLGISRDALSLHSADGRHLVWQFPLSYLRSWHARDNVLGLDFGNYAETFRLHTTEAQQISAYLSDWLDFLQRRLMGEVVERGAGVMGITPEIKQYL